jgi:hypothetical protein
MSQKSRDKHEKKSVYSTVGKLARTGSAGGIVTGLRGQRREKAVNDQISLQAFLFPSEIIERSNKNLVDSSFKLPDFVKSWLFQSFQYRLFVRAKKGLN